MTTIYTSSLHVGGTVPRATCSNLWRVFLELVADMLMEHLEHPEYQKPLQSSLDDSVHISSYSLYTCSDNS